jgi:hypothetical protein
MCLCQWEKVTEKVACLEHHYLYEGDDGCVCGQNTSRKTWWECARDLGVDGRVSLKWRLKKILAGFMRLIGSSWLRLWSRGTVLQAQHLIVGVHSSKEFVDQP